MRKIAFLILAHQDPAHFQRLVKALGHPGTDFYVHVDGKTDVAPFRSLPLPSNLVILDEQIKIWWSSIFMTDATVRLVDLALASGEDYSHLVLLSGSDYPIKPAHVIHDTFTSQPEREFIKYLDMRESPEHLLRQINRQWFMSPPWHGTSLLPRLASKAVVRLGNAIKMPNRWDPSIVPYYGSSWWALTPACCRYVVDYLRAHPSFRKMNRMTFCPEEHVFHSIIGNSSFAAKADGLQPYQGRGLWRLANFHIVHESLTKWYTAADMDEVSASERLFVRKVKTGTSDGLLDLIDAKLLHPTNRVQA